MPGWRRQWDWVNPLPIADRVNSKAQYERRLKQWDFRKYFKAAEWKGIDHRVNKRKREGKESEVYKDGILVPKEKIRKEVARAALTVEERYGSGKLVLSPYMPVSYLTCP